MGFNSGFKGLMGLLYLYLIFLNEGMWDLLFRIPAFWPNALKCFVIQNYGARFEASDAKQMRTVLFCAVTQRVTVIFDDETSLRCGKMRLFCLGCGRVDAEQEQVAGCCEHDNEPPNFYKMGEFVWQAEDLLSVQKECTAIIFFFWLCRCDPTRVIASSFLRFSRLHTTTHHSR